MVIESEMIPGKLEGQTPGYRNDLVQGAHTSWLTVWTAIRTPGYQL